MPTIYRNNVAYSQTIAYGGFTPVGTVISVMGNDAPTNYLKCDGTVYNISAYPDLANYFKAQFGQANKFGGDGTTTFAVPDLRGEFLRGTGTNSHTVTSGSASTTCGSGEAVGTHQNPTLSPNMQSVSGGDFVATGYVSNTNYAVLGYADSTISAPANTANNKVQVTSTKAKDGSSITIKYATRPTNTSVLYCIAYKNIYIENGGGGSGSSGHTIQDTDGNDMPAEDNLQFIGLLVQDDSTNGVTTVEAEGLNADSMDDILDGSIGNEITNNGMCYSTNEQVVGKWIDGKPLYQKTFTFTMPDTSSIPKEVADLSSLNIDHVEMFNGTVEYDSGSGKLHWPFPISFASGENISIWVRANQALTVSTDYPLILGTDAWATIRYTKVTD